MTGPRQRRFKPLKGPNPYRDQVQGRSLEAPAVVRLLDRAGLPGVSTAKVVRRLSMNAPRIAIIHGSSDHPAHLFDPETVVCMATEIWRRGGVPFAFGLPTVCDGTAQSTVGMSYSLLSRNQAADAVVTQMEAHAYHAAVVVQGCDKTPMAVVCGLLMLDRLRRRRNEVPVTAVFAPVHVMRGGTLPADVRRDLLAVAGKALAAGHPALAHEIHETLDTVLLCTTNQAFQGILHRAEAARVIPRREKARLEEALAAATGHPLGGMCGFNGTGNSTRFVLAALGLVHPAVELLCAPPTAVKIKILMHDFCGLVARPERSITRLVEQNLGNAVRVHSALGGSTNLVLHLVAAMNYAGYDFSVDDLFAFKDRRPIPDLLRYDLRQGRDIFRFARERGAGRHRGIESVFRVLQSAGVYMDLDAATVTGRSWRGRIRGLGAPRSAVLSADPLRDTSGVEGFRGNFFSSAVVKVSGMTQGEVERFDRKLFAVIYFENENEACTVLLDEGAPLRALAAGLRKDVLVALGGRGRTRRPLVEDLLDRGSLGVAFIIAGQGPRASGLPEMFTPMQHLNSNRRLRAVSLLVTDGRFSGVTQGPAFGHVTPEAFAGGGLLYLRTGDVLFLDLGKRRLDLMDPGALAAGRPRRMGPDWTGSRARLGRSRQKTLERRRQHIAPTARMDAVTSADHGVVPESVRRDASMRFDWKIG